MPVLKQLKNDFMVQERRLFHADPERMTSAALELQYRWNGTPGVDSLRLLLVPRFRSVAQPIVLATLSMTTTFRSVRYDLKKKGIYDLVLQAKLTGEQDFTDTDIFDGTVLTAGPIEVPRYTVRPVSGGWSQIHLTISDPLSMDLYMEHLWITYGGCRYRYPRSSYGNQDCFVPYQGNVELSLYPSGILNEPIRE